MAQKYAYDQAVANVSNETTIDDSETVDNTISARFHSDDSDDIVIDLSQMTAKLSNFSEKSQSSISTVLYKLPSGTCIFR